MHAVPVVLAALPSLASHLCLLSANLQHSRTCAFTGLRPARQGIAVPSSSALSACRAQRNSSLTWAACCLCSGQAPLLASVSPPAGMLVPGLLGMLNS